MTANYTDDKVLQLYEEDNDIKNKIKYVKEESFFSVSIRKITENAYYRKIHDLYYRVKPIVKSIINDYVNPSIMYMYKGTKNIFITFGEYIKNKFDEYKEVKIEKNNSKEEEQVYVEVNPIELKDINGDEGKSIEKLEENSEVYGFDDALKQAIKELYKEDEEVQID